MSAAPPGGVGIEALNVYCGVARISVRALFQGRGLDPARLGNLMMEDRSIALPCEDPVTHAVNAARPLLERLDPEARASIELLVTSSESGVDYSKSIASYVHRYLGLDRNCRLLEVKQACYGATAALQLAVAYVASGVSPGARVLVVATDVALVDGRAEYAEPAMGTGAAALLVSARPQVLRVDLGAFGTWSYETPDSARPTPELDVADADRSLFAYLDCLSNSFADYAARVEGTSFGGTFGYLALHTPFCGLVKAAHRKLMRELAPAPAPEVEADFARRVAPSLRYPATVGNLCSGSLYLALCSVIDHAAPAECARVGLFSYGSGCSSEFFSGVIGPGSVAALASMRIAARLAARRELAFAEYCALLQENRRCLVPVEDRTIDPAWYEEYLRPGGWGEMLVLREVRGYHREYEWLSGGTG